MFDDAASATYLVQILIAFGAGVISFVSPCVLPLLPGYLSMMSGYSASQIEHGEASTGRMLSVILQFIAGFTLVFAAIGAGATSLSTFLVKNLDTFTRVAGVAIILLALLMVAMAVSNRGLLAALNRDRRLDVRPSRLGRWAPPVMGVAFGFAWTPCIGPVLGVILATAAVSETLGQGILLLVVFSMGLGIPFLLSGLGLLKFFGRLQPYLKGISIVSGVLLAGFGVVMLTGNLSDISSWVSRIFIDVPFLSELANV